MFHTSVSNILTGSWGIPHLELWTRLGSSFSSSYFSFSSSSSSFPSTRPPTCPYSYIPSLICVSVALFLALSLPRFLFLFVFFLSLMVCVCLAVRKSLWGRGRFAFAVKSERAFSEEGSGSVFKK